MLRASKKINILRNSFTKFYFINEGISLRNQHRILLLFNNCLEKLNNKLMFEL